MQIVSLNLKNYKQYKDETIKFPEGLIGFIGNNGAGKSSIFEAISLALYGKFEPNKESVKNDKAIPKESVFVELEFEDKGKLYKAVRELKGKGLKAEAEFFIENISTANSVREVNKELQKVLKIDYSNFKNSFFASQKEVTSLINLNSKEREIAIRKMLGLEKLDKLDEKIKEKKKELDSIIKIKEDNLFSEEKIKNFDTLKKDNSALLTEQKENQKKKKLDFSECEKTYIKLKEELKEAEKLKENFDNASKNIELTLEKISSNKENIVLTQEGINELKKMLNEVKSLEPKKEKYLEVNKQYEELLKIRTEFQKKIELEKSIKREKENLAELELSKNELEQEAEKLKSADDRIENQEKLLASKEETKKASLKTRDTLNDYLSKSQGIIDESENRLNRIKEIGKKSDCPECERPLEDHYDKLVEKYKSVIKENEKEIKIKQSDLKEIESELIKINSELSEIIKALHQFETEKINYKKLRENIKEIEKKNDKLTKEIKDLEKDYGKLSGLTFNENELEKIRISRDELNIIYERYNSIKSKTEELPKRENLLRELTEKEKDLEKRLSELQKSFEEINFNPEEYKKLKVKREEFELGLSNLKDDLHKIESEITLSENKISDIVKELEMDNLQRAAVSNLKKRSNLYERLKALIVEFKSKVTSQELPAISREASKLFSGITKNRYVDLKIDSGFNFKVGRDEKEVELQTLSGGEKDLASLCLRVAISKRISALAGRTNMGFLALDEVFGSQDEDRREELLNALGRISNDFKQIFVVSHNQDVHESFPTRLSIQKFNGYSRVKLN